LEQATPELNKLEKELVSISESEAYVLSDLLDKLRG
jgi:hypothetical protein